MTKQAIFTVELETELHDEFMAKAASEHRPVSQIMHDLVRGYLEQQRQAGAYDEFLRRKVEVARASVRAGRGRSNEEVNADFAVRRANSAGQV